MPSLFTKNQYSRYGVTPTDFAAPRVLGESGSPEFHVVDRREQEFETWDDAEDTGYCQENGVMLNLAYEAQ